MATPNERNPTEQHGPERALRVLVRHSGSSKDTNLANELLAHLRPLERFAGIDLWTNDRIRAGDVTRKEIERAIEGADVALLILSADFFSSDTLQEVEVPRLLERHRACSLRVIPVVLRSCTWEVHPWIAELHPLPKGGKPIASFKGDRRDGVLTELAREIAALTADLKPANTVREIAGPIAPARLAEKVLLREVSHPGLRDQAADPPAAAASTYNINITGTTLGAIAFGDTAKAGGTVHLGTSSGASEAGLDELSQARLRAETAVLPFLFQHGSGFSPADNMPVIGCVVENHGEKPFRITEARATWHFAGLTTENPAETRIFQHRVDQGGQATVNAILSMNFVDRAEFDARFQRDPYQSPVEVAVTVFCQNAAGYEGQDRKIVRWPVPPRPVQSVARDNVTMPVVQRTTRGLVESSAGDPADVAPRPPSAANAFESTAKRAVHEWLKRRAAPSEVAMREVFPAFRVTNRDATSAWVDVLCFPSKTTDAVGRLREKVNAIVGFSKPQTAFAGFCLLTAACSPRHALSVKSMFGRLRREVFCGLVCVSGHLGSSGQFECEDDGEMDFLFHVAP
jgi:hypothetical protein